MERLMQLGGAELQSGIYPGINKSSVPLWADSNNIVFKEMGVQNTYGAGELIATANDVRAAAQAYVEGSQRLYTRTPTRVDRYNFLNGVWTSDQLFTHSEQQTGLDLETWGNWLVITDGANQLRVSKNVNTFGPLNDAPLGTKILKRKSVFLFAINTAMGKTAIEWCDESDIETWTPDAANRAGNYTIREVDSELIAAQDLGASLSVYSENALTVGTFVGAPNVWGFRTTVTGIGAISRRSVIAVGPLNYGLTRNGIFMTDGTSFQYVDDPDVRRWLRDTVNWGKADRIWGFHDQILDACTWYFLDNALLWQSVSFNYKMRKFTKGSLQLLAGLEQNVFDYPVVFKNGHAGNWQQTAPHFGEPTEFWIKSRPLEFGTIGLYKSLQLITVMGTWQGDVKIRVRAHEDEEDAGVVVHDKTLVRENYFDYEAKQFSFEFYGSGVFTLNKLELFGVPGGLAL